MRMELGYYIKHVSMNRSWSVSMSNDWDSNHCTCVIWFVMFHCIACTDFYNSSRLSLGWMERFSKHENKSIQVWCSGNVLWVDLIKHTSCIQFDPRAYLSPEIVLKCNGDNDTTQTIRESWCMFFFYLVHFSIITQVYNHVPATRSHWSAVEKQDISLDGSRTVKIDLGCFVWRKRTVHV